VIAAVSYYYYPVVSQDEIEALKMRLSTDGSGKSQPAIFLVFCIFICIGLCVCVCVCAVATTTGGEDVVGLKATVAELQEQLRTNDKTKEVCTCTTGLVDAICMLY